MSYTAVELEGGVLLALAFSPVSDVFLACTFAQRASLHLCDANASVTPVASFATPGAVMSAAYTARGPAYGGLQDGSVCAFDFENMKLQPLAPRRGSAVTQLAAADGVLVAASLDGLLRFIDPRTQQADETPTPHKTFAMDVTGHLVTLGQALRHVAVYDVRNRSRPVHSRLSGLKYQTSAIRNLPGGDGYVLASVDGRVSVEYFERTSDNYAFRCHRERDELHTETVHPVSALLFHHTHKTLLTGGGDGQVVVWNWHQRRKMKSFAAVEAVSHMAQNSTGTLLAVGTNDNLYLRRSDYNEPWEPATGKVYVRLLAEGDVKPR